MHVVQGVCEAHVVLQSPAVWGAVQVPPLLVLPPVPLLLVVVPLDELWLTVTVVVCPPVPTGPLVALAHAARITAETTATPVALIFM
jgi:hypothetical protein